jgi:hypothetical protein
VNAVLEMSRLGIGALEVIGGIGDVPVAEPLRLTRSTAAKDVPAPVELGLDLRETCALLRLELPSRVGLAKPMLLLDELLDAVADRCLVHKRRVAVAIGLPAGLS